LKTVFFTKKALGDPHLPVATKLQFFAKNSLRNLILPNFSVKTSYYWMEVAFNLTKAVPLQLLFLKKTIKILYN